MGYMKYAVYIGVLLIFALLFNQIVIGLYDLSLNAITGELNSYFLLFTIWAGIIIVARAFLNKKVHPKASFVTCVGGTLHIGTCLALYLYEVNPLFLISYPLVIGIAYWTHQRHGPAPKFQLKLNTIHPEFIDERGGLCVLRTGPHGFTALKFFTVEPPLPGKELLLYLYHQQIECTLEAHRDQRGLTYTLALISHGRHYDTVQQQCIEHASRFREFLRQMRITHLEVSDVLNTLHTFYTPYFLYTPSPLDSHGRPAQFPQLNVSGGEIVIEQDFREQYLTVQALRPQFRPNELHTFLATVTSPFHLQVHFRPLRPAEVASREDCYNQDYRQSLKRLTGNLENDSEFQAASYLFNKVGEVAKEDLEPLLDQQELDHFRSIKRELRYLKDGEDIGLWEVACYFLGDVVLAQTIALQLNGTTDPLPPHAFTPIAMRDLVAPAPVINSKYLYQLLPVLKEAPAAMTPTSE